MALNKVLVTFDVHGFVGNQRTEFDDYLESKGLYRGLVAGGHLPSTTRAGDWNGSETTLASIDTAIKKKARLINAAVRLRIATVDANAWEFVDEITPK